jgi:hypothetical protein
VAAELPLMEPANRGEGWIAAVPPASTGGQSSAPQQLRPMN